MKLSLFPRSSFRLLAAALAGLIGLVALFSAPATAADSGGTVPAGSGGSIPGVAPMPEGLLRLQAGVGKRNYEVVLDQVYIKPQRDFGQFHDIAEMPSTAAMQAYIWSEDQVRNHDLVGFVLKLPGSEFDPYKAYVLTRKLGVQLVDSDPSTALAVAADLNLEWLRESVYETGWTAYAAPSAAVVLEMEERLAEHPAVLETYAMVAYPWKQSNCETGIGRPLFPFDPLWVADDPDFMGYMNPPPHPPNDVDPVNNGWFYHINHRNCWENAAPDPALLDFPLLLDTDPLNPIEPGTPFLERPYTGNNITVAIADDGLDHEHEDLKTNVAEGRNYNFIDDNSEVGEGAGQHGTRVTGMVGMVANRVGGVGVAPRSVLSGLLFLQGNTPDMVDDELYERVLRGNNKTFRIHLNPNGPPENTDSWAPGPFAAEGLRVEAEAFDTVFIAANGNGTILTDNSCHNGLANSRFTIAVAAANAGGGATSYTEDGSNILFAAPAEDEQPHPTMATTDIGDTYVTTGLVGSSYASAMAAGAAALMLQANPDLGWRDVQEIFIATADGAFAPFVGRPNGGTVAPVVEEAYGGDFAMGYTWNHGAEVFGFGLLDVANLVHVAEKWSLLPRGANYRREFESRFFGRIGRAITDETFEFDFGPTTANDDLRVEHVEVRLQWAEGTDPAPARVTLTCPTFEWGPGEYSSNLSEGDYNLLEDQTLMSVGHWGQSSGGGEMEGMWRVDIEGAGGRRLERVTVTVYGTPVNTVPEIIAATLTSSGDPTAVNPREITDSEDIIITGIQVEDADREDPTITFQWQVLSEDSVTWNDITGPGKGTMDTGGCLWAPVANFLIDNISPQFGEEVNFTDTSTDQDGTVVAWDWDFGTGDTSTDQNPTYIFAAPGTSTVSLTVTDDTGRTNTHTFDITVRGFSQDPPDPLPEVPINLGEPICDIVNDLVYPAALTTAGTMYRVILSAEDDLQAGVPLTVGPVIVNSTPVTLACAGEPFSYDSELWINNFPPQTFPPFANVNEISQGALGPAANGEWIEFIVGVTSDFRNYHLTNDIVTFDLIFTDNELWSVIPAGTIIVIYNGDFRDSTLPPDNTDITAGPLILNHNNAALFELPDNGDSWGEISNSLPAHLALQDQFCRPISGVSFNGDAAFLTLPQPLPDATSAHYSGPDRASFDNPGFWVVGTASPPDPMLSLPYPPGTPGVTPGAVNDTANQDVLDEIIADDLVSIPSYSFTGPAWLSINPATGVLSGTPTAADAGTFPVTITFEHSFATETQTFDLIVKPGPPLPALGDLDRDLIINMLEEAFALDPTTATSPADGLPMVGVVVVPGAPPTNHLSISFRVPDGAVFDPLTETYTWTSAFGVTYRYEVQCSTNLVTWTSAGDLAGALFRESEDPIAGDPLSASLATYRTLGEFPDGPDGPLKFLRVQVTIVP